MNYNGTHCAFKTYDYVWVGPCANKTDDYVFVGWRAILQKNVYKEFDYAP